MRVAALLSALALFFLRCGELSFASTHLEQHNLLHNAVF